MKPRVEVGNLDIVRDFTDARDVVAGLPAAGLTKGTSGEIYNLGSGRGDAALADALDDPPGARPTVPIEVFVDPARVRPVDQPWLVADATRSSESPPAGRRAFSIERDPGGYAGRLADGPRAMRPPRD